jgi:hypothetical protein
VFCRLPAVRPTAFVTPKSAPRAAHPWWRREWLAGFGALLFGAALPRLVRSQSAPFELLSAAEARRAQQAEAGVQPPVRTRGLRPQAPAIQVIAPQTVGDAAVQMPLRLEFGFTPAPGARIVPGSFRLLYGMLRIDLTERLRPHATVSERGVLVEKALMPPGNHRMWVQVGDDQGNLGEQELRFRIGAGS